MSHPHRRRPRVMAVGIDVAWTLVDATAHWFTEENRLAVYSALGAGDSYSAIAHALDIAVQMRQRLPAKLITDLTVWLDGYAGHPHEVRLREMLNTYQASCGRCPSEVDLMPSQASQPSR